MKVYVTFGQKHAHRITNATLDKDCVLEINCDSHEDAREIAFDLFDGKFFSTYEKKPDMDYFPRGIIVLNPIDHHKAR